MTLKTLKDITGLFYPILERKLRAEAIKWHNEYQKEIGKLIRFESSKSEAGTPISLADYVLRMNPDQEEIYYINGPSRAAIEAGPYVEMFTQKDIEILYTMEPIDDFVLSHQRQREKPMPRRRLFSLTLKSSTK